MILRNRSRKLILNLKVDDTLTFFERLDTYGIIWHQRPKTSSGHYTYTFEVTDGWFLCKWYIYSRNRDWLSDISAYNGPYILV